MSLDYNSGRERIASQPQQRNDPRKICLHLRQQWLFCRRLTSVVLTQGSANATQATYTYYDGSGAFGNLGDLWTAVLATWDESPSWHTTGTTLYRYYQDAAGGTGFQHGLKYVVEPATYQQMVADSLDPLTGLDPTLAEYAGLLLRIQRYDRSPRGALRLWTEGRTTIHFPLLPEARSRRTITIGTGGPVETAPDDSQRIVYTNHIGQVLLLRGSTTASWTRPIAGSISTNSTTMRTKSCTICRRPSTWLPRRSTTTAIPRWTSP